MQTPTIGRIVHYKLSDSDVRFIQHRRTRDGVGGNPVHEGAVVPLMVTAVWPGEYPSRDYNGQPLLSDVGVNGQAFLDGADKLWLTSAAEADAPGCWTWPPRQ